MEPGERFGYRKPWTAIGEPVCPVEVVREGSHRFNKVRVRWLSGEPYSLGPQSAGHGPMQCAAELWPCPRQKLPGQFTTQAAPGPSCSSQKVSSVHAKHTNEPPQNLAPPVVWKQVQFVVPPSGVQLVAVAQKSCPAGQLPVLWARHLPLRQRPEQHWLRRLQRVPTWRHPKCVA